MNCFVALGLSHDDDDHAVSYARWMIDDMLAHARAGLVRVRPGDLAREMAAGALVIDTRPIEQRARDGALAGAIVLDRNVLEWRLDPRSASRIAETGYDRRIVIVCNEGYSSSLAAATLRSLGLVFATDLIDGYQGLMSLATAPQLLAGQ